MSENDKTFRGNASQFYIAGELCRRGYSAVVTLGNTPNVDILCSNREGTRFAHIQVKTFVPGNRTCSVGTKAMKPFGPSFFWVLGGIQVGTGQSFEYYIIPAEVMAHHVTYAHDLWLKTPVRTAGCTKTTRFEQSICLHTGHSAVGTFPNTRTVGNSSRIIWITFRPKLTLLQLTSLVLSMANWPRWRASASGEK